MELKDEEVRELQMALKTRANELSEMSVRVGLAEKRLENAGKGNEEKISRLEQRLEQMDAQQKRMERYSLVFRPRFSWDVYGVDEKKPVFFKISPQSVDDLQWTAAVFQLEVRQTFP